VAKFKREFSFKDVDVAGGTGGGDDPYGAVGTGGAGGWSGGRDYLDF
jgi:hypothetical protein